MYYDPETDRMVVESADFTRYIGCRIECDYIKDKYRYKIKKTEHIDTHIKGMVIERMKDHIKVRLTGTKEVVRVDYAGIYRLHVLQKVENLTLAEINGMENAEPLFDTRGGVVTIYGIKVNGTDYSLNDKVDLEEIFR